MAYASDLQNIGLIGGGAQGFIKGIEDAENAKRLNRAQDLQQMEIESKLKTDQEQRDRMQMEQALQLKQAGLSYDQGSQQFSETPLTQRQQDQNTLSGMEKGINTTYDPNTGRPTYSYAQNSPQMIAAKTKQFNSDIRAQTTMGSLDERRNKNAAQAGNDIEKAVAPLKKTQQNLARAQGMLDGSVPLSAQNFNLLQQDLIQATAPGGVATEGKMNREMIETYAQKINELKTRFGNITDIRQAQPQVVNQMRSLIGEIKGEYDRAMEQQATDAADSYSANTNPKVQATLKNKLQRYAPHSYQERYGQGLVNSGLVGQQGLVQNAPPTQAGPKVGDVENGYQFLGGDPSNPKSWKKQ